MRWESWNFELIETQLRLYADVNELEYDSSHPFAILPPKAPQEALKRCGLSYAEVAKLACVNYATVTGWFNPRRNPTRATVRNGIFPALCEGCLKMAAKTHDERPETRLIARRVFALLTTGSARTPEEAALELALARERYNRSAISYAANALTEHDLTSIAHSALGFLNLHHKDAQKSVPILHASTFKQESTEAVEQLQDATNAMNVASWKALLETLSLPELQRCQEELELTIAYRSAMSESAME